MSGGQDVRRERALQAARIRFAHTSAQVVSDRVDADVLHIKGASLDPDLNPGRQPSTDADILVRPAHVRRLIQGLTKAGWVMWCDFDEGSLFEHAASFHHEQHGMLDVHQNFPGMHRQPEHAFETLWTDQVLREISGFLCPAPGPTGEHLILLLHAARTPGKQLDVQNHWTNVSDTERAAIEQLAADVGARVGLAAALGELDSIDDPEVALWRLSLDNSDRLGEWVARWRTTRGLRPRMAMLRRATRVNRFQLGQSLGHPPTRSEVWRAWWQRAGLGVAAATRKLRS
ncbi:MAG: nucleotidyltransferase family protein [Propioniciclava sp.]